MIPTQRSLFCAKHTSGNEIIMKLIDFDLTDEIETLDSEVTAPDRTGTILFMPIEILGKTEPPAGNSSMRTRRHSGSGYWLCFHQGKYVGQLWSEEAVMSLSVCKANFILELYFYHDSSWFDKLV